MNEEIAKQCLMEVSEESPTIPERSSYQTYPKVFDTLHLFAKVSRENNMFVRFSAKDVCTWAKKYYEAAGQDIPYILTSSYSLGKFLRNNIKLLPFEYLGTYGNRAIYGMEKVDDK